jgi:protein-arginine kinase activator protein McsA
MKEAVKEERYEKAKELKDEIKKLEDTPLGTE